MRAASTPTLQLVAALLLSGCPVDQRQLALAAPARDDSSGASGGLTSGGNAGATDAGHVSGGSGGSGGSGALDAGADAFAGDAALVPPLVDGCADLDTDGVGDCTVTIVMNADFKTNVLGWTPDTETTSVWDAKNALADLPSGSLLATGSGFIDAPGLTLDTVAQCVPLLGKQLLIVYANAFIAADQDPAGQAAVDVRFFDQDDCAGDFRGTFSTPPSAVVGSWFTVQAGSLAADTTRSASIRLVTQRPLRASSFGVYFDNILAKAQPAQ
ncbi:MAG TPA: hypothetical protein VGI10_13045 [Polyangiaceae bacterium]